MTSRRISLTALTLAAMVATSPPAESRIVHQYADGDAVVLTWNLPAPKQEILRGTLPNGPFTVIGQSDTGEYRDVGVIPGPNNGYQIRDSAAPPFEPLLAVQSGIDVYLIWSMSSPATVEVQRATDPLGPFVALGQTASTTFADLGAVIDPAELLVYRVVTVGPGPAAPTNYAFRVNVDLIPGAAPEWSGMNTVAPPYLYFPDGDVSNRSQTAVDLCTALNGVPQIGSPVQTVARWNGSRYETKTCESSYTGFTLSTGEAYAVVISNTVTNPVPITMVGSHDDRYSGNKIGTRFVDLLYRGPKTYSLVSIPYHEVSLHSEDMCTNLNGDPAATIPLEEMLRLNPAVDTFTRKTCASPVTPVLAAPGKGLYFLNGDTVARQFQFEVHP